MTARRRCETATLKENFDIADLYGKAIHFK